MELVDSRVPDCVEIGSRIVVLEFEAVATSVTFRVLIVYSSRIVQRLVHIAYNVDQKS